MARQLSAQGFSQGDIAARLHLNRQTVSAILDEVIPFGEQRRAFLTKLEAEEAQPLPLAPSQLEPEAQQAFGDFGVFRRRYFGRVPTPWQEDAAYRLERLIYTPRKEFVVFNAPPGAGKTTLLTHDLVCWLIVRNRAIRVLVGARTESQAVRYTGRILRSLERLDLPRPSSEDIRKGLAQEPQGVLSMDYGRFRPSARQGANWSKAQFTVAQLDDVLVTEKETTVSAYGMDSGFLGGRFDLVIWDDLVDRKNIRTLESLEALIDLYETEMETRVEPGGLLVLAGQRMATDDLYRHALNQRGVPEEEDEEFREREDADPSSGPAGGPAGSGEEEDDETLPAKYIHVRYQAHNPLYCRPGPASKGGTHALLSPPWRPTPPPAQGEGLVLRGLLGPSPDPAVAPTTGPNAGPSEADQEAERREWVRRGKAWSKAVTSPPDADHRWWNEPRGCLLDPRRLPWRELRTMMLNREERFQVLYQQEDADPAEILVQPIWISGGIDPRTGEEFPGCWDQDRRLTEIPRGLTPPFHSVASVDPSPTKMWACLAAGTSVITSGGAVAIERVCPGDLVWTRKGWRSVLRSACTGVRETITVGLSNGRRLRLTPDHRVAVPGGGWIQAGDLRPGSLVCSSLPSASDAAAPAFPNAEVLAGVGVSSGAMRSQGLVDDVRRSTHVGGMTLHGQMLGVDAGGIAAEVRYLEPRWDGSPVIEEAPGQAMRQSFSVGLVGPAVAGPVSGLGPFPASGPGDDRPDFEEVFIDRHFAPSAEFPIAAGDASLRLGMGDNCSAIDAGPLHVVSITDGYTESVYDIEVAGEHEFVAEGVVVHNCQWWGYHPATQQRFLLNLFRGRMTAGEFLDWDPETQKHTGLMEAYQQLSVDRGFPITHWIIERNAAQRFLLQYNHFQSWRRLRGVTVIPHDTERNRSDATYGVGSLASHYRYGRIRLPGSGEGPSIGEARIASYRLIDEVTRFPKGLTNDCVMAQWMMEWNLPRLFANRQTATPRQRRPTWLQAVPSRRRAG